MALLSILALPEHWASYPGALAVVAHAWVPQYIFATLSIIALGIGAVAYWRPWRYWMIDREKVPTMIRAPEKIQRSLKITAALPPLSLLKDPVVAKSERRRELQIERLQEVLEDFGVKGTVLRANPGPIVTLYELEPAAGVKSSRIISLADDIARSMSALSARVAVISGKNLIGIELSNTYREMVYLKDLLGSSAYGEFSGQLALTLGKDISGNPVIADLAKMPHVLVAGTTGSGKSVGISSMILSLLYRLSPDQCKLVMIDPKMLELSVYDGIPHLLTPVITEPKKAIMALKWVVQEMENRYRLMSQVGVRHIMGYNQRIKMAQKSKESIVREVQVGFDENAMPVVESQLLDVSPLPFIVVVVDEMADLMMVAGKDVEVLVQRLAQMARAAGIHIIMATQRPSVDVITGTIKANFPTRISFQVTSKIDSRTILGEQGAEHLLGQGDMLFMAAGGRIIRVHGPFVTDGEVESVVGFLKQLGQPQYADMTIRDDSHDGALVNDDGGADLYRQAVEIVRRDRKTSISYLQRQLQIGYNRAARFIEQMEKDGVVSPANHLGKREILR
jgi:S-DNA-T family DNA segregation ATPase FtsK/SpoIIIE